MVALTPWTPLPLALAISVALTACTATERSASSATDAMLYVDGGDVRACEASLLIDGGELDAAPSENVRMQIARIDRRLGLAATSIVDRPLTSLPVRWRGAPGRLAVERVTCFDGRGSAVSGVSLRLENRTS